MNGTAMRAKRLSILGLLLLLAACGGSGGSSNSAGNIAPSLSLTPATLPAASLGVSYSSGALTIGGGTAPYFWSTIGDVPTGLAINTTSTAGTNALTGTPTQGGVFTFSIAANDSQARLALQEYTLTIADALAISTATLPDGERQTPYDQEVTASGGVGPYAWTATDPTDLPPGLTLTAATGLRVDLEGTPTTPGTYTFELSISDSAGRSAQRSYTLDIDQAYFAFVVSDLDVNQQNEMYRVKINKDFQPGTPVKLSGNIIPSGGDVSNSEYAVSPDGKRLAYVADAEIDGDNELYVVDISGPIPGPAVKVNETFVNPMPASVLDPVWSPDSKKLLWKADAITDGVFDIFVADLSGPAIVQSKINPGTALSGSVQKISFDWSHDGRYVAVRSESLDGEDVHIVDTASGPPYTTVQANTNRGPSGNDVSGFFWAPNVNSLLFVGDMEVSNQRDVYAVTITGQTVSTPTKILTVQTGEDVAANSNFGLTNAFSPDATKVALFVNSGTSNGRLWISHTSNGGYATPFPVTTSGDINSFVWSPDSDKVLIAYTSGANVLHLCDVTGTAAGPLVAIPNATGLNQTSGPGSRFGFTPNGDKVWFRVNESATATAQIVDVSTGTPGAAQRFDGPITATGTSIGVQPPPTSNPIHFSPDSTQVAYTSQQNVNDVLEIFLNDVSGAVPGTATRMNPTPVTGGVVVGDAVFTEDSDALLFRGDFLVDGQFRLFLFDIQNGVPVTGLIDVVPNLRAGATGVSSFILD